MAIVSYEKGIYAAFEYDMIAMLSAAQSIVDN